MKNLNEFILEAVRKQINIDDIEKELIKAELDAMDVDLNKFSSESLQGLIQAINDVDTGKLDISNLPPQYQQFSQIISDTESRTIFLSLAISFKIYS